MELTISEIDEQFSNYISDRNNIVKNNGRVNRKYVPLILEPVFTISLDAFKKGYPVALIYKILLQQNKIPGEIRLPTFKAWFFKQRKKEITINPDRRSVIMLSEYIIK